MPPFSGEWSRTGLWNIWGGGVILKSSSPWADSSSLPVTYNRSTSRPFHVTLKLEAISSSETLLTTYKTTRYNLNCDCRENSKYNKLQRFVRSTLPVISMIILFLLDLISILNTLLSTLYQWRWHINLSYEEASKPGSVTPWKRVLLQEHGREIPHLLWNRKIIIRARHCTVS
jgi:hypothetical protein